MALPPFLNQPLTHPLETIPHSDFGSERVRKGYATRSNERDWCLERTSTEIPAKVVTKVGAIRQIEELDKSSDIVTFAKLEVLRDARVKLEKPLAAKIVKRGKLTLARSQAVSELPCTGTRRTGRIAKCGERRFQIVWAARKDDRVRIAATGSLPQHIRVIDRSISTW